MNRTSLRPSCNSPTRDCRSYKEEHNAVSLENDQNIIVEKLKELNSQVTEANNQRIRLESDMAAFARHPSRRCGTHVADSERQRNCAGAGPSHSKSSNGRGGACGGSEALWPDESEAFVQATTKVDQLKDALKRDAKKCWDDSLDSV